MEKKPRKYFHKIKIYLQKLIWNTVNLFLKVCLCTKLLSDPFSLAKLLWFQSIKAKPYMVVGGVGIG